MDNAPNDFALTVVNSTFFNNSAPTGAGGAIALSGGSVTLLQSTLTANSANPGYSGGGLYLCSSAFSFGNSIIAGNIGGEAPEIRKAGCPGSATSLGYNLVGDSPGDAAATENPVSYLSTDIFDTPPLFDPLVNSGGTAPTMRLPSTSPASDKGSVVAGVSTDERGQTRPYDDASVPNATGGNGSDIGAYELDSCTVTALTDTGVDREGLPALAIFDTVLTNQSCIRRRYHQCCCHRHCSIDKQSAHHNSGFDPSGQR